MSWTLDQLAFVARWVIWPLLHPIEERLEDLRRRVRDQADRVGSAVAGTSPPPQQVGFSTLAGSPGSFVGRADVVATLGDAQILYRALGGERIARLVVSVVPQETFSLTVEIQRTDYTRAVAVSFASPIVVTVTQDSDPVDIVLDQPLNPGDCLVAVSGTDWSGYRLDGTIWIGSGP